MPTWVLEAVQLLGIGGFLLVLFGLGFWLVAKAWAAWINANASRINADTKKDEAVTGFAVRFDDERRLWEERHHNLQKEFTDFRIEQARKEGGLDVLEKMLATERKERSEERAELDTKYGKLEVRVDELEKGNKQKDDRIKELEALNTQLTAEVQVLKAEKATLETSNTELQTQVSYERNKALALSELVEKINKIDSAPAPVEKTQAIPERVWDEDAEQTFITEHKAESDSAATVAAEEIKP